jgi:hypothetical protein
MTILPISPISNFPPTIQPLAQAKKAGATEAESTTTWPATNNLLANSLLESDLRVSGEGAILNELA